MPDGSANNSSCHTDIFTVDSAHYFCCCFSVFFSVILAL